MVIKIDRSKDFVGMYGYHLLDKESQYKIESNYRKENLKPNESEILEAIADERNCSKEMLNNLTYSDFMRHINTSSLIRVHFASLIDYSAQNTNMNRSIYKINPTIGDIYSRNLLCILTNDIVQFNASYPHLMTQVNSNSTHFMQTLTGY